MLVQVLLYLPAWLIVLGAFFNEVVYIFYVTTGSFVFNRQVSHFLYRLQLRVPTSHAENSCDSFAAAWIELYVSR